MSVTGGRFDGSITGFGTASGTRFVIGSWTDSPFGTITDVMVETADGRRVLVAPRTDVGRFIADTYGFDEVRVEDVILTRTGPLWTLHSASLRLRILLGRRTPLGRLLALVPRAVARSRRWALLIDPVAARVRPGVHVIGTAGHGREERYCALDEHGVVAVTATFEGHDRGPLRPVDPPVRFGFGSTPVRPSQVRVTTYVEPQGT